MKKIVLLALSIMAVLGYSCSDKQAAPEAFMRVNGPDIIAPDGSKFFIRGTNLGN